MTSDEFNTLRIADYEGFLQRIHVLEQRRGLSALHFSAALEPEDLAKRVAALHALVKWRIERLESLKNVN